MLAGAPGKSSSSFLKGAKRAFGPVSFTIQIVLFLTVDVLVLDNDEERSVFCAILSLFLNCRIP